MLFNCGATMFERIIVDVTTPCILLPTKNRNYQISGQSDQIVNFHFSFFEVLFAFNHYFDEKKDGGVSYSDY